MNRPDSMLVSPDEVRFFINGLDHPEGVAFGRDGMVYAGGESGQVYRISPDGSKVETIANTGGYCLGVAMDRDDRIFICDMKRHAVMVVEQSGQCKPFADAAGGKRFQVPNFAVFDKHGNLYVSDSGEWKKGNGVVYRITPHGHTTIFHSGPFRFANGLALDATEEFLYIVESNCNRVLRIAIRPDGTAGSLEQYADGLYNVPDGIAFDTADNLYVTCFSNHCLYVIDRHGGKQLFCQDEDGFILNQPTNCAFGGPNRKLMLIANLGADHLSVLAAPVEGQPLLNQRDGF